MRIASLTEPALILTGLRCADVPSLLRLLARQLVERTPLEDSSALYEKLWEREQLGTTAIGTGIAIPHCKTDGLRRVLLAVALLDQGIDFGSMDGELVQVVFCIVSPSDAPAAHLQSLAAISKWVRVDRHLEKLRSLRDPESIYRLLQEDVE